MNYAKVNVSAIPSYQDSSYDYTTIAKIKTTYANFQSSYNTGKAHPVSIDAVDAARLNADGTIIFPVDCTKPEMEEFCLSTMNSCKIFEQSDEDFAVLQHELLDSNDQPINPEILNDDGSGEVWWTAAAASTVYTNLLGLNPDSSQPQAPTVAWAPDDDDFMEDYDVPYDNGQITESAWQDGFDAFLAKNIFECFCDEHGTCLGD